MKEIDWSNLSFGYMKTDYNVRINFREGECENLKSAVANLSICTWQLPVCIMDKKRLKA